MASRRCISSVYADRAARRGVIEVLRLDGVRRRERLSARRRRGAFVLRLQSVLMNGRNFGSDDLNLALEIGAIFDDDARSPKIAYQAAALANCNLPACLDIAIHAAEDFDFSRSRACADFAAWPNRQAAVRHIKGTVDLAIDVHVLSAGDLSPDHHRFADDG